MDGCDYFKNNICRSCALLKLSAAEQLQEKARLVEAALMDRDLSFEISPCIPSERAFGSRNKAKFAVGNGALGIPKEPYSVADISGCPLLLKSPTSITEILDTIKHHVMPKVPAYSVTERRGELKFCIIRTSEITGETILRFVVRSRDEEAEFRALVPLLQQKHPSLKVISLNIQPEHKAILEGPEEVYLTETRRIVDPIGKYRFILSPQSFSQVTHNVATKLYELVADEARRARPRAALDLYCGVGTFATFVSPFAESVTGIELVQEAIDDAKASAELNHIGNVTFRSLDVDNWLDGAGLKNFDFIVVNPPRRGLSQKLTKSLCAAAPQTVIYSSCNPETMARDLAVLKSVFAVRSIQPLDMFPMQPHVETLVVMHPK